MKDNEFETLVDDTMIPEKGGKTETETTVETPTKKKDNTDLILGIIFLALIVGVIIYFNYKKSQNGNTEFNTGAAGN